jgi:hypothetical protein
VKLRGLGALTGCPCRLVVASATRAPISTRREDPTKVPESPQLPTFRTWTNDGEEFRDLHPLHLAVSEYYALQDLDLRDRVERVNRLIAEIGGGERRPLPGMLDRMLEIDRGQQAKGCPDEKLVALADVLRTAGGRALRPLGD